MGVRFLLLTLIFGVLFGLLSFHLYTLQIQQSDYYFNKVSKKRLYAQLRYAEARFFTDRADYPHHGRFQQGLPGNYGVPKEVADSKKPLKRSRRF